MQCRISTTFPGLNLLLMQVIFYHSTASANPKYIQILPNGPGKKYLLKNLNNFMLTYHVYVFVIPL